MSHARQPHLLDLARTIVPRSHLPMAQCTFVLPDNPPDIRLTVTQPPQQPKLEFPTTQNSEQHSRQCPVSFVFLPAGKKYSKMIFSRYIRWPWRGTHKNSR